ncbi:MAG: VCBS repeat-containing protein [Melioribacteraceae bacterium]|nr:VCBS repeat-containing protein [Melioribacteraceae bacterium]
MFKSATTLILILSLCILQAQTTKYKWTEIKSPSELPLKIIGSSSANEYLLFDDRGNFYQFNSGNWKKISIPHKDDYIYYITTYHSKNSVLIIAMDQKWYAHFFTLQNDRLTKHPLIHTNPFNFFSIVDSANIYAAGAFGSLVKYDGSTFKIIKNPIKSHIDVFYSAGGNRYWLGTKSDGIFFFDGKSFTKYECEESDVHELTKFYYNGDKFYAQTTHGIVLRLNGNKFYHDNNGIIDKPQQILTQNGPGVVKLSVPPDYRQQVDIPKSYNPLSLYSLGENKLIMTSTSSKIYIGSGSQGNYFTDQTHHFNINPFFLSKPEAISVADINRDGLEDIFFMFGNSPASAYLNSTTNIFSQNRLSFDTLINKQSWFTHVIGEINGDGFPDLVTAQFKNGKSYLEMFYGNGLDFDYGGRLELPSFINERAVENLSLADLDSDGDLDLAVVFYLGRGSETGTLLFFENSLWGRYSLLKTSQQKEFNGWNKQAIFADFNNDGKNDLYVVNKWGKNKLFIKMNDNFVNRTDTYFNEQTKTISHSASVFDYDNDGDLDILVISDSPVIQLLENNGKAFFTNVSRRIKLDQLLDNYLMINSADIAIGDLNNDGFQDIIIVIKSNSTLHNLVLLNEKGEQFKENRADLMLDNYLLNNVVLADIDIDGDLDILGYDNSNFRLLINNLDDSNYLKVQLTGTHASYDARGSLIYLFKSGGNFSANALVGFRQTGNIQSSKNYFSSIISHFGIQDSSRYDVKVKFYGGKTVYVQNLTPGQTIKVKEENNIYATIINLPGTLFRFFSTTEIQIYMVLITISFGIFLFGLKYGYKVYGWDTKSVVILSVTNISAFWIITTITSLQTNMIIKYGLPASVMFIGTAIPLYISFLQREKPLTPKEIDQHKNNLLKYSIAFFHGEWALTNLNGLILLFENLPMPLSENHKIYDQLINRMNSFNSLANKNFQRMIETAKLIPPFYDKDELNELDDSEVELSTEIDLSPHSLFRNRNSILKRFYLIKKIIISIRNKIVKEYSVLPEEVINSIVNPLLIDNEESNITITKTKNYSEEIWVLASGFELAEVIGNCIQNSIRAIELDQGKIEIELEKITPKIRIAISDNGKGISKELWDKIFESGFTQNSSSGIGLFQSREILNKYGGRIYVSESKAHFKTTINIELNEGIKNEANTSAS